jgi:hypothetical protein
MSRSLGLLIAPAIAIAGCTAVDNRTPSPLDQQRLAAELNGRVAGPAVRCLPSWRADDMITAGNQILFRDGRTLYLARTTGGCEAAGRGGYVLVTKLWGTSQLCGGTIAHVVDAQSGMLAGSCAFEDFVPYRRP